MNVKKFFSTTILFLVIVGAIVGFKSLFGESNTLVGVAGVTAALSLLGTDYTLNPIKNTLYFIFIEVGLGVCAYLSSTNSFLGLVLTFLVIFLVLFEFTYNTKKPTYVAFTLGYFFMLYTPVQLSELPTRLISLFCCALAIMALQMLANKNKLQNDSKKTISDSISLINKEIILILTKGNLDDLSTLNNITYDNLRDLGDGIYKRLDNNIKLPLRLMQYFFISQFLESVNLILKKIRDNPGENNHYDFYLGELKSLLSSIDSFINNEIEVTDVVCKLDEFLINNEKNICSNYFLYEIKDCINMLKADLENTKDENIEKISQKLLVENLTNKLLSLKSNINRDSLKFTFAFRGALITSLGVFIVSQFNITNGKWLVFSLVSIVQPYLESSQIKGKDRIFGTVIGLSIFVVLFSIVEDASLKTLIILLVGYISNFQTKYKYQMICTTISALGVASISTNIDVLTFERISFVVLGTFIALCSNKFILPYKMKDVTKNELKKSIKLNKQILKILYNNQFFNAKILEELKEIIATNDFVNKKIDANNSTLLSDNINDFLYNQRLFMNELRFLLNNLRNYKDTTSKNLELFYDINMLISKNLSEKEISTYFDSIDDDTAKSILTDVIELKDNLKHSKSIAKLIENEL